MDFFERWFGFSGVRGDGSLELIFLLVLFAIIVVIAALFLTNLKTKWTNDTTATDCHGFPAII
jgi:hypothetical protein